MNKEDIILEHTRLALEYSNLPVNTETEEEYEVILIRKQQILNRIDELRKRIRRKVA